MWDHVRGNDTDASGRLAMGRAGWFDEVMRWYDKYLKGVSPKVSDPPIAVESGDGRWRSETHWPPSDSKTYSAALRPGSYVDDTTNNGTAEGGSPNGEGIWTFSPAFTHEVRFAGVPRLTVDQVSQFQNANLTADIYDVDAAGNATLISRGTYLLGGTGTISFDMYGDDWVLPAGHRIGVPGRLVQLGVVDAHPDAPDRDGEERLGDAAVPVVRADEVHPGQPVDQARQLQGRLALRGGRGDDRGRDRSEVPAAAGREELRAVGVRPAGCRSCLSLRALATRRKAMTR